MKRTATFICRECGYETVKWLGKCPSCGEWNTFDEITVQSAPRTQQAAFHSLTPVNIRDIDTQSGERVTTQSEEFDRVLGGGIVPGSLVLCCGEPGIGKSTFLLQVSSELSETKKVLYISGEESASQLRLRANRLNMLGNSLFVANETNLEVIAQTILESEAAYVIIDSIQTLYSPRLTSAPGSVSQVRECTLRFMQMANDNAITFFIVGHVTKEGAIAGPRVLEHMVDCVLYFEGERQQSYRILRAVKNRFGSTNEIGVFEMTDKGLVDVPNPSLMLLSGRPIDVPGSAIVCSIEGTRPVLAEVQGLVASSPLAIPRRMSSGVDVNRSLLIIAILEKRGGLPLANQDVYINVTGGIRITEPAVDMAIAAALISSAAQKPLPCEMAFFGEIGLTGEIRTVSQAQRRLDEAKKMGFTKCMLPFDSLGAIERTDAMEIVSVKNIADAKKYILG
ncbi:MAG: DNA repair protein RadA [Clostridia bacterium]|nr:DNA repair protein RadA [Clostridia bacterium]